MMSDISRLMMVIIRVSIYVYYMTIFDTTRNFEFSYINEKCTLQFISTSAKWQRKYMTERNKYKFTFDSMQNFSVTNDQGQTVNPNTKVFMVLYNTGDTGDVPYAYIEATETNFDSSANIHSYSFSLTTNDIMNIENKIRIEDLYIAGESIQTYGYVSSNMKSVIYILTDKADLTDNELGIEPLNGIIPATELAGYAVSNAYTVINGIDFFYNYSNLISSEVTVHQDAQNHNYYNILSVPRTIKRMYVYLHTEARVSDLVYISR